ncbi:hypothetical protein EDEG_02605 [Edhazardia aedis USNM 41457]|uniref:Uncharacterized protein n=1 Tax=Edhazardia aedis (strain USNM 41457) TaxID=1003232 RepID=J8ZTL9_EDHAE|nr:hypothetical protein EDEG_02605 [Edhazardia aedis USNM 41457]|eukprot:EJW03023.1 hypothetical protein EDEG_02605 [Edhazardia aedis USNM 41457]
MQKKTDQGNKKYEFDQIRTTIQQILETPDNIDSETFARTYNSVYKYCMTSSNNIEIRGKEIYRILQETVATYAFSHKGMLNCSLISLYSTLTQYRKSIILMQNIFKYLERFYVESSIQRKDSSVMDVKTLMYFYFYREVMEPKCFFLSECFLNELEVVKVCNFKFLKRCLCYFREVLVYADDEIVFKKFLQAFVDKFSVKKVLKKAKKLDEQSLNSVLDKCGCEINRFDGEREKDSEEDVFNIDNKNNIDSINKDVKNNDDVDILEIYNCKNPKKFKNSNHSNDINFENQINLKKEKEKIDFNNNIIEIDKNTRGTNGNKNSIDNNGDRYTLNNIKLNAMNFTNSNNRTKFSEEINSFTPGIHRFLRSNNLNPNLDDNGSKRQKNNPKSTHSSSQNNEFGTVESKTDEKIPHGFGKMCKILKRRIDVVNAVFDPEYKQEVTDKLIGKLRAYSSQLILYTLSEVIENGDTLHLYDFILCLGVKNEFLDGLSLKIDTIFLNLFDSIKNDTKDNRENQEDNGEKENAIAKNTFFKLNNASKIVLLDKCDEHGVSSDMQSNLQNNNLNLPANLTTPDQSTILNIQSNSTNSISNIQSQLVNNFKDKKHTIKLDVAILDKNNIFSHQTKTSFLDNKLLSEEGKILLKNEIYHNIYAFLYNLHLHIEFCFRNDSEIKETVIRIARKNKIQKLEKFYICKINDLFTQNDKNKIERNSDTKIKNFTQFDNSDSSNTKTDKAKEENDSSTNKEKKDKKSCKNRLLPTIEKEIKYLAEMFDYFDNDDKVMEKMLLDLKTRLLLSKTHIPHEKIFLDTLNQQKFVDFISKARKCIADMENCYIICLNKNSRMMFPLHVSNYTNDVVKLLHNQSVDLDDLENLNNRILSLIFEDNYKNIDKNENKNKSMSYGVHVSTENVYNPDSNINDVNPHIFIPQNLYHNSINEQLSNQLNLHNSSTQLSNQVDLFYNNSDNENNIIPYSEQNIDPFNENNINIYNEQNFNPYNENFMQNAEINISDLENQYLSNAYANRPINNPILMHQFNNPETYHLTQNTYYDKTIDISSSSLESSEKNIKKYNTTTLERENTTNIHNYTILASCKVLTKVFWKINPQTITLPPDLNSIKEKIEYQLKLEKKNSKVDFNYEMSPVFLSINSYTMKITTKMYSILRFIDNNDGLSLKNLNSLNNCNCLDDVIILLNENILLIEDFTSQKIVESNSVYDKNPNNYFSIKNNNNSININNIEQNYEHCSKTDIKIHETDNNNNISSFNVNEDTILIINEKYNNGNKDLFVFKLPFQTKHNVSERNVHF